MRAKGLEKAQEGSAKGREGGKDFQEGAEVSVKGEPFAKFVGSGIYCREELLSLGARASRPHKTWQGRGDWLHRVGRFTRRLTLEQRLDKYAGGTPALPGGNPWLARCRSLSRALFCRSILPPSHARLRILQKAQGKKKSTKDTLLHRRCENNVDFGSLQTRTRSSSQSASCAAA